MADNSNIVDLKSARPSDLAVLKSKAETLKEKLAQKLLEMAFILKEVSEEGLGVEFNFIKRPDNNWQFSYKVFKEF